MSRVAGLETVAGRAGNEYNGITFVSGADSASRRVAPAGRKQQVCECTGIHATYPSTRSEHGRSRR